MKTTKLYIVRHGQTEYNLKSMVQGCGIDAPLNDTGRLQAEAFYQAYRNFHFDKIYTSALKRSKESVKRFIEAGIPTESLPELNEINWGIMEGKYFSLDEENHYTLMTEAWERGDVHLSIDQGESPIQVQERQKKAFQYIFSHQHDRNILICMHGRAIRILLCWILGMPLSQMDQFSHSNMGLNVVCYEDGKFILEKTNDISHLTLLNPEQVPV